MRKLLPVIAMATILLAGLAHANREVWEELIENYPGEQSWTIAWAYAQLGNTPGVRITDPSEYILRIDGQELPAAFSLEVSFPALSVHETRLESDFQYIKTLAFGHTTGSLELNPAEIPWLNLESTAERIEWAGDTSILTVGLRQERLLNEVTVIVTVHEVWTAGFAPKYLSRREIENALEQIVFRDGNFIEHEGVRIPRNCALWVQEDSPHIMHEYRVALTTISDPIACPQRDPDVKGVIDRFSVDRLYGAATSTQHPQTGAPDEPTFTLASPTFLPVADSSALIQDLRTGLPTDTPPGASLLLDWAAADPFCILAAVGSSTGIFYEDAPGAYVQFDVVQAPGTCINEVRSSTRFYFAQERLETLDVVTGEYVPWHQ